MKKVIVTALLFLASVASAQNPQTSAPQPPPVQPQAQSPQKPAAGEQSGSKAQNAPDQPAEHKITPEEGKELFQSMDEILKFASHDTLLPIKHPVKKAIVSREEVEKYVDDKFKDDADRKRFERSELVLKKFGLLPRTFDLHTFLVKLLGEQVAGYYDEKTKTMNLLDWIDPDMQRPVMAHELTHALQDQSYDLEKMSKKDDEVDKKGPEDPNGEIRIDEESTARSAVLEGQAMISMLDYLLAPTGRSVATSPGLVDMMESSMDSRQDSPLFDSAPLLLKQELIFPYNQGMKFIEKMLQTGGKQLAFAGVLDRQPATTREILEPQEYLAGRRVPPLLLPDLKFLKKDFVPFDAGAVGQLDVNILLSEYAGEPIANQLSPEWRGGSYYAAGRKNAKPPDRNSTAHIGLLYVSKWSRDAVAQQFAEVYEKALPKRYTGLQRLAADPAHPERNAYQSSDGPIFIQRDGNVVVVSESFDPKIANRLIESAAKQAEAEPAEVRVNPPSLAKGLPSL